MNETTNPSLVILFPMLACLMMSGCGANVDDALSTSTDASATYPPSTAVERTDSPQLQAVRFEDDKPVLKDGTLFAPKFILQSGETVGGMMFAAQTQHSKGVFLLSAMHLLGPATGMEKQLTVDEITANWSSVVATELVKREERRFLGLGLGLPGASAEFEASQTGDVIVFLPDEHEDLKPISIAESNPKEGDALWLLSPCLTNDSLIHRATFNSVIHDGFLVYEFDEPIVIAGTSGAPIVNEQGLVVAVHRGGGTQGGRTLGVGTLATRFLPSLTREIQANSD